MRGRLTPAFAAKAATAPGAKRTTYWDAGMPGFGLMVTANGHRSYVVQYRAAGRSKRMHLKTGLHPPRGPQGSQGHPRRRR